MRLSQPPKDGSLLPGYRVECRECGEHFMKIVKPLRKGEQLMAEHFMYLDGTGPQNHDDMLCRCCGAPFHDFELEPKLVQKGRWRGFSVKTIWYGESYW